MCHCITSHSLSLPSVISLMMDSFYIDQRVGDSRQSRSRTNSHLSSTAAQFQGLSIAALSSASASPALISTEDTNTTPSYLDRHSSRHSGSFVTSPGPQTYTPFPLLSESDLDPNWTYDSSYLASSSSSQGQSASAPVLRLNSSQDFLLSSLDTNTSPQSNISSQSSNQSPSNMRQAD